MILLHCGRGAPHLGLGHLGCWSRDKKPQPHHHLAGPRNIPGNLTCRNLCLLCQFLCEGDLEPFLRCKGWQNHITEDGLDGHPVPAWWHPVCLGKEVGSGHNIIQVGVL